MQITEIRQRIFKHTAMQVLYFFSRQNLQTFDISHAFLSLTIVKLSTIKNGPVFLAHPVDAMYRGNVRHGIYAPDAKMCGYR